MAKPKAKQNNVSEIDMQIDVIKKAIATKSLKSFLEYDNPNFVGGKHIDLLCDTLEKVANGDITRLIITMPPRHGKSEICTKKFPSWYLGTHSADEVIISSYSIDLARDFSKIARDTLKANDYFPSKVDPKNESAESWGIENARGGLTAAGVGGGITGKGAKCFPKGTMVMTGVGEIEISTLVAMKNKPLVLTYNHKTDIIELKKIIAVKESFANEFTIIETSGGNKVKSTKEHRYYTKERGYTEASFLDRGNTLVTIRDMQHMWQKSLQKKQSMQRMLQYNKKIKHNIVMCKLWEYFRESSLRIRKSIKERARRFLLLCKLQRRTFQNKIFTKMQSLWECCKKWTFLLFKQMQKNKNSIQVRQKRMSSMPRNISTYIKQNCLLFTKMCGCSTFKKDDRKRKFSFQNWNKLFEMVFRNEANYYRKRQLSMRMLWDKRGKNNQNKFSCSPYRRKPIKQHSGKLNNNVSNLSYDTPQINTDTIYRITNVIEDSNAVYDIQVEGNHNFFANGILAHNCFLIDDPIKNADEANSEVIRESIWQWYLTTAYTRLTPDGRMIIIMTRWHEDDLVGRLLDKEEREIKAGVHIGEKWTLLNLPALAEENDILGREVGEPLWAEYGFNKDKLLSIKLNDERVFLSLYQQRPSSDKGNMFKREWWKFYDKTPLEFDQVIQSWDLTFKSSDGSDRVAGGVFGLRGADIFLLDFVAERMDFVQTIEAILKMSKKYPQAVTKLIEDKANGPAVISMLKHKVFGLIAVEPKGGKIARANAVMPIIESGNVYLPNANICYRINELIEECASFPRGKHDDLVDMLTQALSRFLHIVIPNIKMVKSKELRNTFDEDIAEQEEEESYFD